MKNNFQSKRGFSLIELLITIAIIGILSTIILGSISNSRAKANDSKIKQQLSSFRTASEIYFYNQVPNSYGPAVSTCDSGIFSDMSTENGSPGKFISTTNLPQSVQRICQSSDSSYAIKVSLYTSGNYWCVDSAGVSMVTTNGNPSTACP